MRMCTPLKNRHILGHSSYLPRLLDAKRTESCTVVSMLEICDLYNGRGHWGAIPYVGNENICPERTRPAALNQ